MDVKYGDLRNTALKKMKVHSLFKFCAFDKKHNFVKKENKTKKKTQHVFMV